MNAHCLRCGRPFRSPKTDLYGRRCASRLRAAASVTRLDDYSEAQIAKAREAIEQGGVIATRRPRLWTAVSSDGSTTYLAAREACTCPAGARGVRCYHRAAVAILTTARTLRAA
ncbi:hypothetical protein ACFOWE_17940 [Planomonospora corallina]|uniref:SWIM-type domain-containing protein n=1 Tax=Planomonospora corallina TaxID=1806052 RepID=A0ABV8IAY7_9ACTN